MAITGAVVTPQKHRDSKQPPLPGEPYSRATFFLRSTPKVFTVIVPGGSNQDMAFAAYKIPDPNAALQGLPFGPRSRVVAGAGNQSPENPGGVGNIASAEAFGEPHVRLLRVILRVPGIGSAEAFGATRIGGILPPPSGGGLSAEAAMHDTELYTCWVQTANDLYLCVASDSGPVYSAGTSDD